MTKDEILVALLKLSRADLEAIHATAGGLLGGRVGNIARPANPLAEVTFQALSNALSLTAGLGMMPDSVINRFNAKLPHLLDFLDDHFVGWDSKRLTQQAFLQFLFSGLKEELSAMKVKPNITTMTNHLNHMPKVIERNFPGYLKSGLGGVILKQFQ